MGKWIAALIVALLVIGALGILAWRLTHPLD